VGLFKAIKDLAGVTRQARHLQEQQQVQAGYDPGMRGMVAQMGDMVGQMNEQLKDIAAQSGDEQRLLAEGLAGEAVIVAMGTPARGAQRFNLGLDLEIHVSGRPPYRVANQYIVPASAAIGPGVRIPVRVDPIDPAKIAIDWDNVAHAPAPGEVRPVGGARPPSPAQGPAEGDVVDDLERLARLRESGALTEAEFEQQKARILAR
jgi:Short C-terminal domain